MCTTTSYDFDYSGGKEFTEKKSQHANVKKYIKVAENY